MKVKDRILGLKAEALEFAPAILQVEQQPPLPLPQVARRGGKLPETINGRLAVRVALASDSVQNM